jgi:NDP-sugar pyrophosphorylase family protein
VKAVILAAGVGSRLGEITRNIPKPMLLVGGKPVLENNIMLCEKAGIKDIYINLHHLPEVISGYFRDGSNFDVKITYFYEKEILGTAGALLPMVKSLKESPVIIIYGDNYFEIDLNAVIDFHNLKSSEFTIVVHKRDDVKNSGVVMFDEDLAVTCFVEKPTNGNINSKWVNAGVYVINDVSVLKKYIKEKEDYGRDIIPALIKNNHRVFAYQLDSELWPIDTPEMLERTKKNN